MIQDQEVASVKGSIMVVCFLNIATMSGTMNSPNVAHDGEQGVKSQESNHPAGNTQPGASHPEPAST
jgi:hypothetical protein